MPPDNPIPRPDPRSRFVQDRPISRVPPFTPVPLRPRPNGWTPYKQAEFLGLLAETRCVKAAALRVGMSRESAYRLRRKPGAEEFAAVWDVILGASLGLEKISLAKVTLETLLRRVDLDRYRPILRAGRYVGVIRKPDNAALVAAVKRLGPVPLDDDIWGAGAKKVGQ